MTAQLKSLCASLLLLLAACAGSSQSAPPASGATIEGTVTGANALTVAVPGTALTTTSSASGSFVLIGVPAGTKALRFSGASTDATLQITATVASEDRVLAVTVSGHDAQEEHEQTGSEFHGKVDAVTPPTLSVAGRVVTTNASTRIHRGDTAIALADIKAGDLVEVRGALQTDGSVLAADVEDGVSDTEDGVVFAAALTAITDATHLSVGGIPVVLSATTKILRGDATITEADLKVGDRLLVRGSLTSGVTVAASSIRVLESDHDVEVHVAGPLAALSLTGGTLQIGSTTIAFDNATKVDGDGVSSVADLKLGDALLVEASRLADGSLLALEIHRLKNTLPGVEVHGAITALSLDAQTLAVAGKTFSVNTKTEFGGTGDPKSLADLKVGDPVGIAALAQADGTLLAIEIHRLQTAPPPPPPGIELHGLVTAISLDAQTFAVGNTASSKTVAVNASTVFSGSGGPKSLADLHLGDAISIKATAAADGSLTATLIVRASPSTEPGNPEAKGAIQAIGTDGITVAGVRFAVDATTMIHLGDHAATLADLKVGQTAEVHGTARANLPPLATSIQAQ